MDNSHVALVAVKLDSASFKRFRCDRPMPLGVNLNSLTKVLKCAKDDDICILKATDDADVLNLVYESPSASRSAPYHVPALTYISAADSDRIAEYDMKLMDIDSDTLGIPDTDYDARVTMPSSELTRIVRDLSQLGESVRIEVSKDGVRFVSDGEAANGSVLLKQTEGAARRWENYGKDDEEGEDEEKTKKKVKKEDGGDVEMNGEDEENDEIKANSDDEGEEEQDDSSKKRKKTQKVRISLPLTGSFLTPFCQSANAPKKAKRAAAEEGDADGGVYIEMNQHVNLTFSLKYLVNFSKSASLSNVVQLMMSNDVPLLVSPNYLTSFQYLLLTSIIGIVPVRPGPYSILPGAKDWR